LTPSRFSDDFSLGDLSFDGPSLDDLLRMVIGRPFAGRKVTRNAGHTG
jgi:hypothetical protein